MAAMKSTLRIIAWLALLVLSLPAAPLRAAETPTGSVLAGQWRGKSCFTGISYEEATHQKVPRQDVETVLNISPDGTVTGRVGGAELSNGRVAANRGWLGRMLSVKTDFIIRGQVVGAVVPGSESGTHAINAPFNVAGSRMVGTLFVVYPIKYPYPFLSLRLSR